MTISLYDASVGRYLQILGALAAVLDRGLAHCAESGLDPDELIETRLYPDMAPLRFQIQSAAHHSIGAVEGVRNGRFSPPPKIPALGYRDMQKMIAEAIDGLNVVTPEAFNALEDADVTFSLGDVQIPFTATGFLLSFSLPNFFFHATTTYDILRMRGTPLGKRDYLGKLQIKR